MRFVSGGISIPDELLVARDEGAVVFFCGAGASRALMQSNILILVSATPSAISSVLIPVRFWLSYLQCFSMPCQLGLMASTPYLNNWSRRQLSSRIEN